MLYVRVVVVAVAVVSLIKSQACVTLDFGFYFFNIFKNNSYLFSINVLGTQKVCSIFCH